MTPATAKKGTARYRYYVSSALTQGRKDQAGSVTRVAAPEIERAVVDALENSTRTDNARKTERQATGMAASQESKWLSEPSPRTDHRRYPSEVPENTLEPTECAHRALIERHLQTVIVRRENLQITVRASEEAQPETMEIPWSPPPGRRKRDIIIPEGLDVTAQRPIRAESRARLVEAIAKARHWVDQLILGEVKDTKEIAVNR
jgi:site-specific DNA recombinase